MAFEQEERAHLNRIGDKAVRHIPDTRTAIALNTHIPTTFSLVQGRKHTWTSAFFRRTLIVGPSRPSSPISFMIATSNCSFRFAFRILFVRSPRQHVVRISAGASLHHFAAFRGLFPTHNADEQTANELGKRASLQFDRAMSEIILPPSSPFSSSPCPRPPSPSADHTVSGSTTPSALQTDLGKRASLQYERAMSEIILSSSVS